METPKWDLFERLEKLEEIGPKMGKIEPELDRVAKMGILNFQFAFISMIAQYPSGARWLKDKWVGILNDSDLGTETVKTLEKFMLEACDKVEEIMKK